MKLSDLLRPLLILAALLPAISQADLYLELSPAIMQVNTPDASSHPKLLDFRLGYEIYGQQAELALMTSVQDGKVNQLAVEAPLVVSLLYHYMPQPDNHLKFQLIFGLSQVNIKSSYPGTSGSDDSFSGLTYGFGLEEAFVSIPQLKLSLDWLQLYRGSDLHINATSLGVHYEF
jgi:hypothetical protein